MKHLSLFSRKSSIINNQNSSTFFYETISSFLLSIISSIYVSIVIKSELNCHQTKERKLSPFIHRKIGTKANELSILKRNKSFIFLPFVLKLFFIIVVLSFVHCPILWHMPNNKWSHKTSFQAKIVKFREWWVREKCRSIKILTISLLGLKFMCVQ